MTDQIETNKRGLLAGALTLAAIPAVGLIGTARAQTADGGIDPTSALAKVRQSGTLKMGYAQTAPWFFKDPKTGDLGGIYYDVAEALAAALQVKSAYQEVSWSDSTPALRRGDFEIFVSSLTYTVPRATSVAFPTPPLWARGSLPLIHKDNAGKFKTAADLNSPDVTIAVNTGTSAEAQQKRLFPKAKVLATTGQILSATEPVRSKRADAWLNGDNDVIAFAHKNAALGRGAGCGTSIRYGTEHLGGALRRSGLGDVHQWLVQLRAHQWTGKGPIRSLHGAGDAVTDYGAR